MGKNWKGRKGIGEIAMTISDISKDLEKHQEQFAKCINATCSDFGKRAPGWVSQEIRKTYNISPSEIKSKYKGYDKSGKVRIGHTDIDNIRLKYKGRPLNIIHFEMRPKKRPNRPYNVSARIFNHRRKMISSKAFIGVGKGDVTLAFKRKTRSRYPIRTVQSLSVPQMVTSPYTEKPIQERISKELTKRWDHNVDRFNK